MTWRWRIFFKAAALAACALVCDAATVTGRVRLEASKDKRVQSKRDFSGVVVWLEPASGGPPATPRTVKMGQKNKTFLPHVLAIPVNSTIEFPNFDPIFHNAFSNFSGQVFDVGLYPPGSSRSVRFRRQGIVRVFCNIHPHMSAVIAVLNTPWFAVTEASGSFAIDHVPAGEYLLNVFHERALEANLESVRRKIAIPADRTIPELAISESGYLATPHKNKFGKEYPSVIDDRLPTYGGAAR